MNRPPSRARLLIEDFEPDLVADLTADFVEEEIGRLDWLKNLNLLKDRGLLQPRLDGWLARTSLDPSLKSQILSQLEQLATNPGRWR